MMWPFVWVFGVFAAIGKAIAKLFAKRPYEALCELVAPWTLWGGLPRAIAARRRVSRQESVPIGRLGVLVANRQQVAQWHDRVQALSDQRHVVLLSPLAKAHLRRRAIQRWLLAVAMALVCFGVVAVMHGTTLRAVRLPASLIWPNARRPLIYSQIYLANIRDIFIYNSSYFTFIFHVSFRQT